MITDESIYSITSKIITTKDPSFQFGITILRGRDS